MATTIQTLGYKIELVDLDEVKKLPKLFDEFDRLYTDDALRSRAKEDGASGIPITESPLPSPFERELVHAASQLASTVSTTYKRALEQVDGKIKLSGLNATLKDVFDISGFSRLFVIVPSVAEAL